ncbi:hypothetical protein Tco_0916358, partial [Tanacetum coccineum]
MGTMWCLCDPTSSGWCKMDAHSMDFGLRIQTNILRIFLNLWTHLTLILQIGRTSKLQNDILMFQQHQGESLSEVRLTMALANLALYDHEGWNDPRDFSKLVK